MSIAARCTCGNELYYCNGICPNSQPQIFNSPNSHIFKIEVNIDWDIIEAEFKKQMWSTPSQFQWIKEQIEKQLNK